MAAAEILQTLQEGLGLTLEAEPCLGPEEGPARLYRVPGSATRVGLIATLSAPTCDHCHRVRLGSHGQLKACIFGGLPVDLLGPLRSRTSHEDLVRLVRQALTLKQGCLPLPGGGLPNLARGPLQVGG
jgi:cyclic pyranopterin phosphate synthase